MFSMFVYIEDFLMKLILFNSKPHDVESFRKANISEKHELVFVDVPLNSESAVLAADAPAICVFVNDIINAELLKQLYSQGTRLITLRCAGYNNIDIVAAKSIGIQLANVPAYSPHTVAEHALALILALNRHIAEANNRVHTSNFSLEGLKGFELHGKTAGIIGTGRIGAIVACTLQSLGMRVLATDPLESSECCSKGIEYVDLATLLSQADVISLHCPLTDENCYLINEAEIAKMKQGVMLINTSRGGVLNTQAAINGLQTGQIGYLGIDVYEYEQNLFFRNLSEEGFDDDTFKKLLALPNVLITPHQAFFTDEALENISTTTLTSLAEFEKGQPLTYGINRSVR